MTRFLLLAQLKKWSLGDPLRGLKIWSKIANLVRLFHENVTLEVDLDDDGNTIIIKYNIGVKQGDTLAPVRTLLVLHSGGTGDSLSQVRGCRN